MSVSTASGLTLWLAERASSLEAADMPDDVPERARQSLLDWFAVTLGGSHDEASVALLAIVSDGGPADAQAVTAVGHRARLSALDAALVNGTSSHVLDFDDVNLVFLGHPSVAVLAAALALAEQSDLSVAELLTAYVAGYETACRLAAALGSEPYRRGFHTTGTLGTIAAAAACARLLALDTEQTAVAIGIAASEAAGLKANFGTMTKSLHAGNAARQGLLAALLAARGFTANRNVLEAEQGFAAVSIGDFAAAAAPSEPSARWHLRENLFKHHASCFFTHSTIEGLRRMMREHEVGPEHVQKVTVHVSDVELGTCAIAAPATGLEVKFSLAHLSAMTLLGRSTAAIDDGDAADPEAVTLRRRVALVPDGEAGRPTRVELLLRDGRRLEAAADVGTPASDLGAQRERLAEKFRILAEPVLGPGGAAAMLGLLIERDGSTDVRELMAGSRPAGSALQGFTAK